MICDCPGHLSRRAARTERLTEGLEGVDDPFRPTPGSDDHHIETQGVEARFRVLSNEDLCCIRDPALAGRRDRVERGFAGIARLDLDEGDGLASFCDQVDLAGLRLVAAFQDTPAGEPEPPPLRRSTSCAALR